jgi:GH15 family glucan-1,4-alpha-glucosidase
MSRSWGRPVRLRRQASAPSRNLPSKAGRRSGVAQSAARTYPAIAHYALIGDCHSAALVSRMGSIDWCCLPRFDSDSCFGRLLDWTQGGHFAITPLGRYGARREYLPDSLILVTTFRSGSAAGNADELQVLYGVDGKRRLPEINLDNLEGWRGSRPVRIGNGAARQFQLDMYGLIVQLSCRWSEHGVRPAQAYWSFLVQIVEAAIAKRRLPDRGIWEVRSRPRHFVHSKVMCWVAADGGVALAEKYRLHAPVERWRRERDETRREIEAHGVDHRRGIFVQSYGSHEVDAALLLLPLVGFVRFDDERMIRTTDVIRAELERNGLILRYRTEDGLQGREGVFLACTFWLAECLARQGRRADARKVFNRAIGCANDVGLFAEEHATAGREMLGNFPQGLTHLSHISAALALGATHTGARVRRRR